MSNRIVITSSSEFEGVINEFEKILLDIKKIFENELGITGTVDDNSTIWQGESQKAFNSQNTELSKNYPVIVSSIETYIKFLKNALNDYEELDRKISTEADKVTEKLDVKS